MCVIARDLNKNDRTSKVISAVREIMANAGAQSMNANEVLKKMSKGDLSSLKLTKDQLMEILEYYKKLQIIFVDCEDNIIFL